MITVLEKNEHLNIIHCVMGEPTDMQMDFEGSIMLDISPMLADVNPDNPIVLKINRCQNEERLVAKLTMDKVMREQMQGMMPNNTNKPKSNVVRGKCIRCGQLTELPIVNGKVQPCKECQIIDAHLKQKPMTDEELVVGLNDADRKLVQSLMNQESKKKKPICKKRSTKPKGEEDAKNDIQ